LEPSSELWDHTPHQSTAPNTRRNTIDNSGKNNGNIGRSKSSDKYSTSNGTNNNVFEIENCNSNSGHIATHRPAPTLSESIRAIFLLKPGIDSSSTANDISENYAHPPNNNTTNNTNNNTSNNGNTSVDNDDSTNAHDSFMRSVHNSLYFTVSFCLLYAPLVLSLWEPEEDEVAASRDEWARCVLDYTTVNEGAPDGSWIEQCGEHQEIRISMAFKIVYVIATKGQSVLILFLLTPRLLAYIEKRRKRLKQGQRGIYR